MRLTIAAVIGIAAVLLTGCTASGEPAAQQPTTTEGSTTASNALVPGYTGGCEEGFVLFVQNQFEPYGTTVRWQLDVKGVSVGLNGNEQLKAVGWTKTTMMPYPDNPVGIQGVVWFRVQLPSGEWAWVSDSGVRAVPTEHAPNNEDEAFVENRKEQEAPQDPACELRAA